MIHMIEYDIKLFLRSIKGILPLIATLIFIMFTYYPGVITRKDTAIITSYFYIFYIMLYIGYMLSNNELDIPEQCLYIRCINKVSYYLYKVVCVLIFSIIFSTLLILATFMFGSGDYNAGMIIYGWMLMVGSGFCGGALGQLFHPAFIRDRKLAMILMLITGVLCACRTDVINAFPVLKYIYYVLPPIDNSIISSVLKTLCGSIIIKEVIILVVYGIIYEIIKSYIWHVKKYID